MPAFTVTSITTSVKPYRSFVYTCSAFVKPIVAISPIASFESTRTPIVSGSEYSHSYFVTHGDASAYGANRSAWRTHPETAAIDAMLGQVQSCQNALWQSWQVFSSE